MIRPKLPAKKELFSIGWTADMDLVAVFFFFLKDKKKVAVIQTPGHSPTQRAKEQFL